MSNGARILVVTTTFPRQDQDDQPRFVLDLCKTLATDHQQLVLAPASRGFPNRDSIEGIDVVRFRYFLRRAENLAYGHGLLGNLKQRPLRWLIVPFLLFAMARAIRKQLREFAPAIVHAHWWAPAGLAARIAIATSRSPARLIISCHGSDFYTLGRRLPWLQRKILNAADAVAVVSPAMRDQAQQQHIAADRLHVAPMGADLKERFTADANVERRGLLFVGRLTQQKGIGTLLRAFAACRAETRAPGLTIIGEGPQQAQLQEMANALAISDNVEFRGAVLQRQLPQYFRRAALLVFPSIDQEGLGLVAIEAMACECPVLAADVDSLADLIVDAETGFSYAKGETAHLTARLDELLASPETCQRVARAGAGAVRARFDWSATADNYRTLYNKLLTADA